MNITEAVVQLIALHNRVVIPGVGALEHRTRPAEISEERITAPSEEYLFDPSDTQDDKMLRNYLAEQNGIPASRAAKDIEAFIADVKGGGGWSEGTDFQGIGHISFQTESGWQFTPAADALFAYDFYGIDDIEILPDTHDSETPANQEAMKKEQESPVRLAASQDHPDEPEETDEMEETSSRRWYIWLLWVLILALIVWGIVLLIRELTGNKDLPAKDGATDSIELADTLLTDSMEVAPSSSIPMPQGTQAAPGTATLSTASPGSTGGVAALAPSAPASEIPVLRPDPSVKFYVVIASFETQRRSKSFIRELNAKGVRASLITYGESHYRVVTGGFTDLATAQKAREQTKKLPLREGAWILDAAHDNYRE